MENSAVAPQSSFEKSINNKTEDSVNVLIYGQANMQRSITNEPEGRDCTNTGIPEIKNSVDKTAITKNDAASDQERCRTSLKTTGTDHVSLPEGFKVRKIIYPV